PGVVGGDVQRVVLPVVQGDDRHLRVVADEHLHVLRVLHRAGVVEHEDRGGGLLGLQHDGSVAASVGSATGDVDVERGLVDRVLAGHQVQRLVGAGRGDGGGQILRHQHGAAGGLAD